jgi:CHAD domain-containing protein
MGERVLTADEHVAEAGRIIMSQQLDKILYHEEGVRANADVTAVHEMRKSIRRTFTCFKLFRPYFEHGILKRFQRGLRRIMRRLGYSRDLAVFRMKLDAFDESTQQPLDDLSAYWDDRQKSADSINMRYLTKSKSQIFLGKYRKFTQTPGMGVKKINSWAPIKFRHHMPILIYQRVAAVRAFDDKLNGASAAQLHRLRIQFKELRYTLQFFAPLLGEEIGRVLLSLKQSQEILGDLNDTSVALRLLDETVDLEYSVARYREYQENEKERLIRSFSPVWQQFDQPQWRRDLAEAMAIL